MHLVPWDYDFTNEHFDGLFISNGPGDPALARKAIENVSQVRYPWVSRDVIISLGVNSISMHSHRREIVFHCMC